MREGPSRVQNETECQDKCYISKYNDWKISYKHPAFFEEISYCLPECTYIFVCHQGFEYYIISMIRNTNWPICHINSIYSQRVKYPNLPLHIRETSRKQSNISRSQQGIHDKLSLQHNYDIPKGKCTSLANYS